MKNGGGLGRTVVSGVSKSVLLLFYVIFLNNINVFSFRKTTLQFGSGFYSFFRCHYISSQKSVRSEIHENLGSFVSELVVESGAQDRIF